jgi:hypothetical protein
MTRQIQQLFNQGVWDIRRQVLPDRAPVPESSIEFYGISPSEGFLGVSREPSGEQAYRKRVVFFRQI